MVLRHFEICRPNSKASKFREATKQYVELNRHKLVQVRMNRHVGVALFFANPSSECSPNNAAAYIHHKP